MTFLSSNKGVWCVVNLSFNYLKMISYEESEDIDQDLSLIQFTPWDSPFIGPNAPKERDLPYFLYSVF